MILFRKKLIYLDKVFFINKLKKFLKYFLNFFGLDIVQLQSIQNDLQIIFKNEINKNIKIKILDIGAFTGNSIYEFREIFINSSIYSLEPSIYNFELLKKNTANLKDVKIFNIAASNKNGSATFYHNSWEYTSSLLKLNNSEYKKKIENKFKYRGQNNTTNSFNVKVNSLDSFIEENNIKSIDILKIDTQGNEIKVL